MARKNWTRGELILALDLFMQEPQPKLDDSDPEVKRLSALLRQFPLQPGETRSPNYRSANSVALKLQNLLYVATDGERGQKNGGALDKVIYEEFAGDILLLREAAESIRMAIDSGNESPVPDDSLNTRHVSTEITAREGQAKYVLHRVYERDSKISERKKAEALKRDGELACEVCDFNFSKVYGERGEGYIECHHTKPVSQLSPDAVTSLSDLALLCANCHRMIHRKTPWLSIDQLKESMRVELDSGAQG